MKSKLLIISDLWGFENAPWIKTYSDSLKSDFQLVFYDSYELAGMDKRDLTESELHFQFINGGIDSAVNRLVQLEKEEVSVLAFSIGGTMAWKAALMGLKIKRLYAVSSTRLRYEIAKPTCAIHLIFSAKDEFMPKSTWFSQFNLEPVIIKNESHEIYKEAHIAKEICGLIKIQVNKI